MAGKKAPKMAAEPPITRKEIAEVTVNLYSNFTRFVQGLIPVVARFQENMDRIAKSLEELAEYERQKTL